MNKKAFEVSINFIVMLILSIAVFGFGLYFINQVFNQAKDINAQLDQQTQANIEQLLSRGERVAFPISSKDIKNNGVAIYGLGVLNVNDNPTTFHVNVACSVAVSSGNVKLPNGCDGAWTIPVSDFTLDKNAQKIIPIAIQPPPGKPSGTYAFTVTVSDASNGKIYGDAPKQIYVNIA